jgi:DNA-binding NarL/FixJ family response regulator
MEDKNKPVTLGVLKIDFNLVVREGLLAILNKDDEIEVIANVPNGHEALQYYRLSIHRF